MSEPNDRITVSRETLRAELAEMELRLTRWVASADSVKSLEGRVANLEASRIAREYIANDLSSLERTVDTLSNEAVGRKAIRTFMVGGLGVVAAINGIAAALVIYFS